MAEEINYKNDQDKPWDIFISWNDDKGKNRLRGVQLKCFLDLVFQKKKNIFFSADIPSGEWRTHVKEALNDSNFLIILLTNEALDSGWVNAEYGAFYMKEILGKISHENIYALKLPNTNTTSTKSPIKDKEIRAVDDECQLKEFCKRVDSDCEHLFNLNYEIFKGNIAQCEYDKPTFREYVDVNESSATVIAPSARPFDSIEFSYDKPVTTTNETKKFFGRKKYVENLHKLFFENGQNCINVVAKGGMGKTSIAYIYVRDYIKEYKNIQFVVCNDDILSDFNDELRRRICKVDYYASKYPRLEDIRERESMEEDRENQKLKVLEDINTILSDADSNSKNLLVIDVNVDKVGLQSIYMPQDVKDKWHILYLSREYVNGTLKMPLYNFKDQDNDFEGAKGLFEHIYTRKKFKKKDLENLFDSIYYHPLLIEQLAAYGMDAEYDEYQNFCNIVAEGSAKITGNFSEYTINYKGKEHDIMRYINKFFNIGRYKDEEQYVIKHFASWEYDFIHFNVIDKLLNLERGILRKTLNGLVDKVILLKSSKTDSYRIHGLLKEKLKDDIKKFDGYGDYFDNVRYLIENDGVNKEVEKCIKNIDAVYLPWLEKQPHPCLPPEQTDKVGYTFVNIPLKHYGTIKMMKVRDGLYIAETQVTQSLWETVMKGTKLQNPSDSNHGGLYPVDNVSWYDCIAFIMRLNKATGSQFRLPTSEEWKFAAGRHTYSGCDDVRDLFNYAWYSKNAGGKTHPVATDIYPNELGIYDMSGNVWEWCLDWSSGSSRVLRGGSWFLNAYSCRVSNRGSNNPGRRILNYGLRLALPCSPFPS